MKKLQGLRNLNDGRMVVSYEGFKYMEDRLKESGVFDEWVEGGFELVLDINEKDFTNSLIDSYGKGAFSSTDVKEFSGDDLEDFLFGDFDYKVLPLGEYAEEWKDRIMKMTSVFLV